MKNHSSLAHKLLWMKRILHDGIGCVMLHQCSFHRTERGGKPPVPVANGMATIPAWESLHQVPPPHQRLGLWHPRWAGRLPGTEAWARPEPQLGPHRSDGFHGVRASTDRSLLVPGSGQVSTGKAACKCRQEGDTGYGSYGALRSCSLLCW